MSLKRKAVSQHPMEYKLLEKELEILTERTNLIENEKKTVMEMMKDIKENHEFKEKINLEGVENEENEVNVENEKKLKQVFEKFIEHILQYF